MSFANISYFFSAIVSEATDPDEEGKKEAPNGGPSAENDFRIGDTEDSKLFRKFLNTWDGYFNCKQEVSTSRKANCNKGNKKRRSRKQT